MKYKIIEVLKTFSAQDIKRFDQFLNSPFFNDSHKICKLYKILIKHHPEFSSKNLTEENLSKELNPDLPYNKSTFKSLLFEMANLADEYLKIINFQGKKIRSEDNLREEYFVRRLYKHFHHNIEKSEKILDADKNANSEHFLNKYFVITDKHNYLLTNKPKSNKNFISQAISLMSERTRCLSLIFVKEVWTAYDSMISLSYSFDIDKEKNFIINLFRKINFEELIQFLISTSGNKHYSIVFELNLSLYKLFSDFENEENYYKYKKLIIRNVHLLGKDDINFHFGRLITYCMMKKSTKNISTDFRTELFVIYKYMLLKKYYEQTLNTYLPIELFRMIVKTGLEQNKYKWTLDFINKYYNKLHPDRKVSIFNYSLGEYYFHRKRYDEALRSFQKVKLDHFMFKLDIKSLMLMTYYELGLYENALPLIDTFKKFLTNNEMMTAEARKRRKNFIDTVHKMIQYKTSVKTKSKFLIEKHMTPDIPYKTWLEEKLSELDNGFTKSA